jgi:outer membrane lipoprotein SlyB
MKTDFLMRRAAFLFVLFPGFLTLAGCKQAYSPNTYASNAAQEEAAVQRGVIIGVRQVMISADGTVGAAAGGAAGGAAGAQVVAGGPVVTALGAIGGTLAGGIGGVAAAHAVSDTKGWEYIVQEDGAKLVSVTQTSKTPLPVGQHVLVIAGAQQARIVPDYTVQTAAAAVNEAAKNSPVSNGSTGVEVQIGPLPAPPAAADDFQGLPDTVVSGPAAAPSPAVMPPATAGAAAKPAATSNGSPATGAPGPAVSP